MRFARVVCGGGAKRELLLLLRGERGRVREGGLRVRVFWGGGVVGAAAKKFGAVLRRLL